VSCSKPLGWCSQCLTGSIGFLHKSDVRAACRRPARDWKLITGAGNQAQVNPTFCIAICAPARQECDWSKIDGYTPIFRTITPAWRWVLQTLIPNRTLAGSFNPD
jgi:hypothetical protein